MHCKSHVRLFITHSKHFCFILLFGVNLFAFWLNRENPDRERHRSSFSPLGHLNGILLLWDFYYSRCFPYVGRIEIRSGRIPPGPHPELGFSERSGLCLFPINEGQKTWFLG